MIRMPHRMPGFMPDSIVHGVMSRPMRSVPSSMMGGIPNCVVMNGPMRGSSERTVHPRRSVRSTRAHGRPMAHVHRRAAHMHGGMPAASPTPMGPVSA
jgi:hypothetical protein